MAGASLLALLDDIATLLDDIAVLSKVAVQKTAGVLGDDLALNAQQVTGMSANRELPVVWAVAKGSLANKAILVPAALLISYFMPWGVIPLLMLGGLYLCYEGVEKLAHKLLHGPDEHTHHQELLEAVADVHVDLVAFEKEKIAGAIRTDFVLSAEIIVITLGIVAQSSFFTQLAVLVAISLIMTVGVYGLVGGIVKLDDVGLALSKTVGSSSWKKFLRGCGSWLLWLSPTLLKTLSVLGTLAMFAVGGGIIVHGFHWLAEPMHHFAASAARFTHAGKPVEFLVTTLLHTLTGLVCGVATLTVVEAGRRLFCETLISNRDHAALFLSLPCPHSLDPNAIGTVSVQWNPGNGIKALEEIASAN